MKDTMNDDLGMEDRPRSLVGRWAVVGGRTCVVLLNGDLDHENSAREQTDAEIHIQKQSNEQTRERERERERARTKQTDK